jgi:hypothetical protein
VFFAAAVFTILSAIIGFIYFVGVWSSLKFDWLQPAIPYFHAFFACAVLLWIIALVMDYVAVRHAALEKPSSSNFTAQYGTFLDVERNQRTQAITDLYKHVNGYFNQADLKFNELFKPKIEPTLKQRTIQLANDMFALLRELGPEPPHALSHGDGTVAGQEQIFNTYFDWQRRAYYNYMAHFRDRVIKTDYELAAEGIMTKLDDREISPASNDVRVDIKKIAEALLLTAQRMP